MEIKDGGYSVSEAVSRNYALYGQSTLQTKIAHVIDGIKCVARRILWTIGTNEKPRRVTAITGSTLEKYHPSGDMSINDAISRLAQPYNNIVPLISSDTNVGMYGGGKASAPKYLDVYSAKFTQDVFFNGIDKEVYKYVQTEYGEGVEPEYLIPKIPMALITGDFGMAIGHKTELAMLELNSVCELVKKYISLKKQYGCNAIPNNVMFRETAELLIPDFPIYGLLRNRSKLMKEYSLGNYDVPVVVDGILEIHQNNITITSLPWGISPSKVDKELGSYMVEKLNSYTPKVIQSKLEFMHKHFNEVGEHSTGDVKASLELTMKRGVSPFLALEKLKELSHFNGKFNPNTLLLDTDGVCKYMTPINIVEIWYQERVKSILNELKIVQNRYVRKVRELEAQIIIIDHTNTVTKIFQESEDDIEACLKLAKRFGLTEAQARFIREISMADLTRKGKDALVLEKEKIEKHLDLMKAKFNAIDDAIYEDVDEIQRKYAKQYPRKCMFPDFTGAIRVDNGFIQTRSVNEIDEYISRFGNNETDIVLYPSGPKNKFIVKDEMIYTEDSIEHPREFVADDYIVTRFKPKFTICMNNDGAVSRVQGIGTSKDLSTTFVGDQMLVIDSSYNVSQQPTSNISLRKTLGARGALFDSIYFSDMVADEVIVATCNSREKNNIRFSRVTVGKGKVLTVAIGKTEILGVFRVDCDFAVSVPNKYLNRCNVRHLLIKTSDIKTDSNVKIDLNKRMVNDGRRISKLGKGSYIYSIK